VQNCKHLTAVVKQHISAQAELINVS